MVIGFRRTMANPMIALASYTDPFLQSHAEQSALPYVPTYVSLRTQLSLKFSFDSVTRIARIERRLLDADRKTTRATFICRIDAISKTGNIKETTGRKI